MSDKIFIYTRDGIGGSILAVQAAYFVKRAGKTPVILVPARDEVFKPFHYLVSDQYTCLQAVESFPDLLLESGKIAGGFKEEDEVYIIYPDGVYKNPYSFDYAKYKTSISAIKNLRVLTHKFNPTGKQIYLNLNTTTDGYLYQDIPALARLLAERLPAHTIHLPIVLKWSNKKIDLGEFNRMPANVVLYRDPDFIEQIDLMSQCGYGIYTDSGVSHISYALGQDRLILDPRFGYGRESLMWRARWRQNDDDSIRISSSPEDVVDLIYLNLTIPQTLLLPKQVVLNGKHSDWSRELLFKY